MIFWNVFGTRSASGRCRSTQATTLSRTRLTAWSALGLGRRRCRVLSRAAERPGRPSEWRYYSRSGELFVSEVGP